MWTGNSPSVSGRYLMDCVERAIGACLRDLHDGKASELNGRAVLRGKHRKTYDVAGFEQYFDASEPMLRRVAFMVSAVVGDADKVATVILNEPDKGVLFD